MAVQPIPAAFTTGTDVVRISGFPGLTKTITPGVITRTTKTLAEVTFTSEAGGNSYTRTYVYKLRYQGTPDHLTGKDQEKYTRDLDEVFLPEAEEVAAAHRLNAQLKAQSTARMAAGDLAKKDPRWLTREDIEEHIALLQAQLEALPARQTI